MGSAVTPAEITRHLEAYAAAGIGGVEITPIYGAKGAEDDYIPFLSPKWQEMIEHTVREGQRIGIGVDLDLSTGWPFGGPHIPDEMAPRGLRFLTVAPELAAGVAAKLQSGETLLAATAILANGEAVSVPDLARLPAGVSQVVAAIEYPTRQQVKRPAPGGEGNVMCPYRRDAFAAHAKPYERMFENRPDAKPRAVFYDSFEVFGANYAPGLDERFRERHDYDFAAFVHALAGSADRELVARVRCDYRDTLFSMLLEDGVRPWREWASGFGIAARYQAHGAPGNLLDLYAASDIPETEVFGTHEFAFLPKVGSHPEILSPFYPLGNKFASSGARLAGRKLVSSETFTWHREHFASSFALMKPEVDQLIHTGINHLFFHGSTYSPADAAWPGWLFYASTHFDPGDTLWRDLPEFAGYITEVQSVAQNSEQVVEALVYFPFHDAISNPDGELFLQFTVHKVDHWFSNNAFRGISQLLWDQNVGFAYVSDRLLQDFQATAGGLGNAHLECKVLLVPKCQFMPAETFEKLQTLAAAGARVVFVDGYPESVPGLGRRESRQARLDAARSRAISPVEPLAHVMGVLKEAGVSFYDSRGGSLRVSRFREGDTLRYFATNFSAGRAVCELPGEAPFELAAGESRFVKAGEAAPMPRRTGAPLPFASEWTLRAMSGGPMLPPEAFMPQPVAWTSLGVREWEDFSGTAVYSTVLTLDAACDARLEIEHVGHSVRVLVNDTEAGCIWALPYRLELENVLRAGENRIMLEVTNLSANRIRAMDRDQVTWRIFHDINFANLHYSGFDASKWSVMRSGLWGRVSLTTLAPH